MKKGAMEKISLSEDVYKTVRPTNDVSEVLKLQIRVEFSELRKLKNISVSQHQTYVMPCSASKNSSMSSLETKYFKAKYLVI